MVAISEKFRRRWERGRARRETEELEVFAALLMALFCPERSARHG
jgi:hypothetical protein